MFAGYFEYFMKPDKEFFNCRWILTNFQNIANQSKGCSWSYRDGCLFDLSRFTLGAFLISPGSKILRLQAVMSCTGTDTVRKCSGEAFRPIFLRSNASISVNRKPSW